MIFCRCDQCRVVESSDRYAPGPTAWLVIEQDAEDPLQFCSWSCLATYAAQKSIDAEVGP